MTLTRRLARPMLASTFVYGGIQALKNTPALAEASKPVNDEFRDIAGKVAPQVKVPADDVTLVRINAGVQIAAGLGLATGRLPRLSALALAGSVVPTTIAGHPFWQEKDKVQRNRQMTHFFKNLSMLGGLILAALDTEGRPGVAWRTSHAVGTATKAAGVATTGATKAVGSTASGVTKAVGSTTSGVTKGARGGAKLGAKNVKRRAKRAAKSVKS